MTDYPERAEGSDRAFIAFTFKSVSEFERESGDLERFKEFEEHYQASMTTPPVVVQEVQFARRDQGGRVQFWFGPNFGGLRFVFDGLKAVVRDARVWQEGHAFHYVDSRSGLEFDFYRPLPEQFDS
ncbi:MAG: hypothetical protein AB7S26_43030 [Sandaracinaceae bacterium]